MKTPAADTNYFFVDESGDPTFYDRRGNLIVGQEGCSPILILGFVETPDPSAMRCALADLHAAIAADEYLRDVPSISQTNLAFHAKDDVPEVRQSVFKRIRNLEFKAQFVVARKIERVFRNTFHASEGEFYDYLVRKLFQNSLHRHEQNHVYFSQRGSRRRQKPLEHAIREGVAAFEQRWHRKVDTRISVQSATPVGEPCLQVVDYMNWSVYRAFVKRDMRYFRFVEEKVSLLVDWYDQAIYPHNYYTRANPFDIEKASPL